MRTRLHKTQSDNTSSNQSLIRRKVMPKFTENKSVELDVEKSKSSAAFFGGEVTNSTNTSWLISGGSNSDEKDFNWLSSQTNSDNMEWVQNQLDGDVDAVWPAGKSLNGLTSGVFKIRDHRNANIDKKDGKYVISDYSFYFSDGKLPSGWKLPQKYQP